MARTGDPDPENLRLVEAREVLVDERGISLAVIRTQPFPNGDQVVILETPMPPDDQMVDRGYWVGIQRSGQGWPLDDLRFYASLEGARSRFHDVLSEAMGRPPGSVEWISVEEPPSGGPVPERGALYMDENNEVWVSDGERSHRVAPWTNQGNLTFSDVRVLGNLVSGADLLEERVERLEETVAKLEETLSTLTDLDVVALHKLLRYVERLGDPDA